MKCCSVSTIAIWLAVVAARLDAELYQAPLGRNGTWTLYETVSGPLPWADAKEVAEDTVRDLHGVPTNGNLVAIGSPQENALVEYLNYKMETNRSWIGLTDREGAADGAQESASLANPMLDGWAWTSGEAVQYVNWAVDEPRNHQQREDVVSMDVDGRWSDQPSGYDVDQPLPPVLQAGTSLDEKPLPLPFVIEYSANSATPLVDVPVVSPPPRLPSPLPGVHGEAGMLGVSSYRMPQTPTTIQAIANRLTEIQSGTFVPTRQSFGQFPKADLIDPEVTAAGGPLEGVPLVNPGHVEAVRDQNVISVAKGTVYVDEPGTYTVRVHSGGPFALQIGDHEFREVAGKGQIDALDERTLYFSGNTLDSGTRATVELTEGYHALRFVVAAALTPYYWEIATAQGSFVNDSSAQWLPIGSTELLSPLPPAPVAVKLTRPATVANLLGSVDELLLDLDDTRERIREADRNQLHVRDDVATLVLRDSDGVCCLRPGAEIESEHQFLWPGEFAPDQLGPDDHFSSLISGTISVDNGDAEQGVLEVTFGLFADDLADLWIQGASFLESNSLTDISQQFEADAIMRPSEFHVSGSAMLATIQLSEGVEYAFESTHVDGTADAGFELFAALGRHLEGFDPAVFFPVSTSFTADSVPGNRGLPLASIPGDHNMNGMLDADDIQLQIEAIETSDLSFDLNSDGITDASDLDMWITELKQTWIGDSNLDGQFDSADLVLVLGAGRFESGDPATWENGDWNGDGQFSSSDLVRALTGGGYEQGPLLAAPVIRRIAVPEASSLHLLTFAALMALTFQGWRNQAG